MQLCFLKVFTISREARYDITFEKTNCKETVIYPLITLIKSCIVNVLFGNIYYACILETLKNATVICDGFALLQYYCNNVVCLQRLYLSPENKSANIEPNCGLLLKNVGEHWQNRHICLLNLLSFGYPPNLV